VFAGVVRRTADPWGSKQVHVLRFQPSFKWPHVMWVRLRGNEGVVATESSSSAHPSGLVARVAVIRTTYVIVFILKIFATQKQKKLKTEWAISDTDWLQQILHSVYSTQGVPPWAGQKR
jgi:hypothetical protein